MRCRLFPIGIAALSAFALIGVLYGDSGEKQSVRKQPECCQKLLSRIDALEKRVRMLEARSPTVAVPERYPEPPLERRELPPGAQEREFNGMKYYIIPLEKPGTAPPPPRHAPANE